MAEKVTVMVLNVDLQCPCCYKKVKKILCKIPQIRDQEYNEKANTITITVVCCNPEKIRDKLCCKGAKVIKSIEIKEPPKPDKPKKIEEIPPPPDKITPKPEKIEPQIKIVPVFPRTCCRQCYEGHDGGPCYHGYGVPRLPFSCLDGYNYAYGYGWPCHVTCRCDYYICEENPQACSIM